ncbi:hypothetical protein ACFLU5_09800 [Bacteroidota bacterium]
MYKRKLKSFFPVGSKVSAGLILIIGVMAIYYGSKGDMGYLFIGLGISLISIFMITAERGIIIDFEIKKYKNYWGLLGLKFGSWKSLPEVEDVVFTKYKEGTSYHRQGSASILRGKERHCAYLMYHDSRRKILASVADQFRAEEDARYLADQLEVPIE